MTFLVKLTTPEDEERYYRDGDWLKFQHQAQTFASKGEADAVVNAVKVFVPGEGTVEVVEA